MRRSYFSVCAYALVLLPFFLFIAALLCLVWERSSALLLCFLPFQYLCVLALLSLIRQTQALERENRLSRSLHAQQERYLAARRSAQQNIPLLKEEVQKRMDEFVDTRTMNEKEQEQLLGHLLQEYSRLCSMNQCHNHLIDALFYNKKLRADEAGIPMQISIMLPESIPIAPLDLLSVFNNLLDNAIEACILLPKAERSLSISAMLQGNQLYIRMENSKLPSLSLHAPSSKGEGHGLGMPILHKIATRYNGSFTCEDLGPRARFTLLLSLPACTPSAKGTNDKV